MEIPYCLVDGVEMQLVYSENGVLRFPNTYKGGVDLNQMHNDYTNEKINLDELWKYYTQSGTSFEMVEGLFSKYGMNNHTVTNGNGRFKKFEVFSGDDDHDDYFKDSNIGIDHKISNLSNNYDYYSLNEKIDILTDCLKELKKEL